MIIHRLLFITFFVDICLPGEAEDDWLQDDPVQITKAVKDSRQIAFPSNTNSATTKDDECEGSMMYLRQGEGTVVRSHRSYGKYAYKDGYRCKYMFQPVSCDLNVVCHMKTREGSGSGSRCQNSDYLRIMRGKGKNLEFSKKYCGRQTASLKFSGDDTVKLAFQTGSSRFVAGSLDGWSCKIVCLPSSSNKPAPKPQESNSRPTFTFPDSITKPSSVLSESTISTTTISTTTTTTSKTTRTTTSTTTSTATSTTPSSDRCECGIIPPSPRIICPPGQDCTANPGSIPWQAGLTTRGTNKPFCGGTLINSKFVLTAAHCLEPPRRRIPRNLFIVLGDHDWTQVGESEHERFSVRKVIMHPDFRKGANFNMDFSLVELNKQVDFDQASWIRPACLPQTDFNDFDGYSATVSGWGFTDLVNKGQSKTLQVVDVTVMNNQKCTNLYSKEQINENMMCGSKPGADSCFGDSGGPFTVQYGDRWVLAGVVSWGQECARAQWPGVYARVSKVLDWIHKNSYSGDSCDNRQLRQKSTVGFENRGERRS